MIAFLVRLFGCFGVALAFFWAARILGISSAVVFRGESFTLTLGLLIVVVTFLGTFTTVSVK